ncbi:hypothetical protein AYO44_06795 [Planctomycetaceae bacterium SCGC AG-212-F19]|nr:hypothetical protein AYO44_06795 [Planctomycetaceae bacterium SCGC AG-212-F19]
MLRGTLASSLTDAELVVKYAASRSKEHFAALVARHGPMVLRTCCRLTSNTQDAEDAAQATFLALSQKPTAAHPNVAGWLYKVARDCAYQVMRERASRSRREEVYARMKTPPSEAGPELREELDAALVHLPGSLREAVVLRYLEGRDSEEAARLAGCNENTLRWRSMKGLERLRAILGRRQAVVGASVLVGFLASEAAASAASAPLASLAAIGTTGAVKSGQAALVAKKVLDAMFWAKVKLYGVTTAVGLTVAGAASVPFLVPDQPSSPPTSPTSPTRTAPVAVNPVQLGVNASLGGRRPFPDDSPWNKNIAREPADPASDQLIASIGRDKPLFANFGPPPAGTPYIVVSGEQAAVPVRFEYPGESDPGPYPIPADQPVPPARLGKYDFPMIVLDRDHWKLYEISCPQSDGQGWRGAFGAVFDLGSTRLRPAGWNSADPAGLPIFPGLVRYDEVVEQQSIQHALRFTCRRIRAAYVDPARHSNGTLSDPSLPPMGMRVRLRADFDISGFPPPARVILKALQEYGMFLAEYGTDWYLSGTGDPRWNDPQLKTLTRVKGKDFEVVRMGELHFRSRP